MRSRKRGSGNKLGVQQLAVLSALSFPRCGKQILERAKEIAPKITFFDLRHIIRSLEKSGYVACKNPANQTGRIYELTDLGVQLAKDYLPEFRIVESPTPVDWELYARISRSKSLYAVLVQFSITYSGVERFTPTQIRKSLLDTYPMSLSWTIGTITKLRKIGLLAHAKGGEKDERLSYYSITPKGRILANILSL